MEAATITFRSSHRFARPPDDTSLDELVAEWRRKDEKAWGCHFRLAEFGLYDTHALIVFEEKREMPQYVNPANPNAGELIVTKVDPVTGIAVQVNPNVTPGFLMPQPAPTADETPDEDVDEVDEPAEKTIPVPRGLPKPDKTPQKVVKPVEKAGEKTESPAPVATRGTVTTHSATATHVDDKK